MQTTPRLLLGVLGLLLATALPAIAQQSRLTAGATVGLDRIDADFVSGQQPAVGGSLGVALTPTVTLEAEILRPAGSVTRSYTGPSIAFGPPPVTLEDFVVTHFTSERSVSAVVSAGVAFHPSRPVGRFTPRVFAGVTNYSVTDRRTLSHLSLPPGVTIDRVNQAMPPEERRTRQLGALTAGASLAIAVTRRLSIAPDVRYDYGSIGDEINNTFRTSLRVLWRF